MTNLTDKPLGIEVVKRVMGWTEWQHFSSEYPLYKIGWGDYIEVKHSSEGAWVEWAPWRDMNDAMEVVHKLIAGEPWECYISHQTFGWECFFLRPDRADEPRGQADELPEAILLAALATVEEK